MKERITKEWIEFLQGSWVKEMPQRSGTYPVASRDGSRGGDIVVYCISGQFWPTKPWGGFWWSVPIPELQDTPDWEG